jgi:predicted 3-demethylubiquinone-9 3-methyltransferase (glyoxalase superfamily)
MLWFDNQAEEAANFYVSVFKNSKVKQITHYAGEDIPEKKGQVMTVAIAKKAEVVFIENLQLFCERALRSLVARRKAGQAQLFLRRRLPTWR